MFQGEWQLLGIMNAMSGIDNSIQKLRIPFPAESIGDQDVNGLLGDFSPKKHPIMRVLNQHYSGASENDFIAVALGMLCVINHINIDPSSPGRTNTQCALQSNEAFNTIGN
jgi:hypothetical protein